MGSVIIGGEEYEVYGSQAAAIIYWNGRMGPLAAAFKAKEGMDEQMQALVMAHDLLERQDYIATAATFALRDAIQAFQDASYQLAAMVLADTSVYTQETSGKNIKKIEADVGVSVEFFKPTLGITGRFQVNVQELIGEYLQTTTPGSVSGSYASGNVDNQTSSFDPSAFDITKGL